MALVEDDHSVELGPQPIHDLLDAGNTLVSGVGAQRGVGGEKDAVLQPDGRTLAEPGQRLDEQPLLPQRRPVALGVLDQGVGLGDPERAAAALEPVVEDHARDLAALARAGAVTEHEPAPEAHRALGVVGRGRDHVEGGVHRPRAREDPGVRLAGEDHRLELSVGQQTGRDQACRQVWPVGRRGRAHAGHRGRLDQRGGMRSGARHAQGLEREGLVEGVVQACGRLRRGRDQLVAELHRVGGHRSERASARTSRGATHGAGSVRRRRTGGPDRRAGGAWRDVGLDPGQQGGGIRRHPVRGRKGSRVGRGHAVDHGQPRLDRRAVPREYAAVHRRAEHHAPALLQSNEGGSPGRGVGGERRAGDRDQPPAVLQPRQRGGDVAIGGVGDAPFDVRADREGRVHQHHVRAHIGIEVVVDLRGVEARDGGGREQDGEKVGPRGGQLVQRERAARKIGEGGEQAGAGRRLEHEVTGGDRRGAGRDEPERDRRRELLERLALLRAAGVGRQQRRDLAQHGELRSDRARQQGGAEPAQEQQLRDLARLVGVLPAPSALRVGAAAGVLHGSAQRARVDRSAAREVRQEALGSREQRRGGRRARDGGYRRRNGGGCGTGVQHGEGSRRAETGEPSGRSLQPAGSLAFRPPSPSQRPGMKKGPGAEAPSPSVGRGWFRRSPRS